MDDTIKLDRRSFEALAADSRVRILKSLAQQRKTLTELAKEIGLSNSTMKEHLDVLVRAGLIIQRDEGRKWKYYDLTRKGHGIASPHPTRVLIMLALSLLLVMGSGWNFINAYELHSFGAQDAAVALGEKESAFIVAEAVPPAMEAAEEADASREETVAVGAAFQEEPAEAGLMGISFPYFEAILMGLSVCIFVLSLYYAKRAYSLA